MKNIRVFEIFALITIITLSSISFLSSVSADSGTTNYAVTPTYWRVGETWNAPTYVDYNVLHTGNPSIRMEKGPDASKSREILDGNENVNWAIYAKPGDHIVFSVWMKTSASTIGDTSAESGIRLGISFFNGNGQFIADSASPDGQTRFPNGIYPSNLAQNYVNWGSDWQQRTMDFILQSTYYGDGSFYPLGTPVTSSQWILTPWVQVWSGNNGNLDNGVAWLADAELYINPPTASSTSLSFTCTPTQGVVPWTTHFQGTLTTNSGVGVVNAPIDMQYWNGNSWQSMGITTNTDSTGAYAADATFLSQYGWIPGMSANIRATFAGDSSHYASVSNSVTVSANSQSTYSTFGSTSIGSSVIGTGNSAAKTAGYFQLTTAGVVTKLTAYISGSGYAKAAIYSDLNGQPNLPVGGATVQVSVPASAGWVDFVYASPVHLTAGYYWLALIDSSGCNWYYNAGGVSGWKWISYLSEPSAPFGAYTARNDLISIYATYTAAVVSSGTFGSSSVGSSVIGTGNSAAKTAGYFQLTTAGVVTKLTAYISGSGYAKAAIYSDLNGQPNLPVGGATVQVSVPASAGWVDFVYASPVHLTAGYYWLALIDSSGCNWYYNAGGVSGWKWISYLSEPSAPFGAYTARNDLISIYATYTAG